MRILILTSCTGEKAVQDDWGLTLADFRQGPDHGILIALTAFRTVCASRHLSLAYKTLFNITFIC